MTRSSRARARLMREALVNAKVGLSQSRAARDAVTAQLERERKELATVLRRGQLAAGIKDAETVRLAAEFERKHCGRIEVLERKHAALDQEVALVERETAEMTAQLKRLTGAGDPAAPPRATWNRKTVRRRTIFRSSIRFAAPPIARRARPMRTPVWRI